MPTKREKEISRDQLLADAVSEIRELKLIIEELVQEVKNAGKSSSRNKKTS